MEVPVNYLAVVACAISNMIIGTFWYGPLFGKTWMKLAGVKMDGKSPIPSYIIAFVSALIGAYVIAHFVYLTSKGFGIDLTIGSAISTVFWGWLGFVAPPTIGMVIWEGKSWGYWAIVAGYWLVAFIAMATILASWQ